MHAGGAHTSPICTRDAWLCLWCCQVCYWRDMEQQEAGKKQRTLKNETAMMLTGLEGNTLYQFTVKGFNSVGQGPASAAVTAKTRRSRECSTAVYRAALLTYLVGNLVELCLPWHRDSFVLSFSSCSASKQPDVDSRRKQCVSELGPSEG